MKQLFLPEDYTSVLDVWQTEHAIKFIKDTFQLALAAELKLRRITAPIVVPSGKGLNDNLSGTEQPVSFGARVLGGQRAEIVQSLAKWKRYALWRHHIQPGMGIYTDMNALRPDETIDNIHSVYVDQWDWEKIISKEERNMETLEYTVRKVYSALKDTEDYISRRYNYIEPLLPDDIFFITSQELEDMFPDCTPKEREHKIAKEKGIDMIVYTNEEGVKQGINPFDHGSAYTDIMKTQALKQALTKYGFTAAFGGGRRDEEKSRAKERIFSFRNENHAWDPKNQRPEMWKLYNTEINKGESIRVFPISNWTEKDIWQYIKRENIPIVPLYFAKERPVVYRDGNIIMVDDDRMRLKPGEKPEMKKVRFRTLGCYPLTGGILSDADTLDAIIDETLSSVESERTSRIIDSDGGAASMEKRKREGYF